MCNPASFIITRNRVFWSKKSHSHENIISENGLSDGIRVNLVRVEISPPGGDFSRPLEEWVYRTDQDMLPEWYVESAEEKRVRDILPLWAKHYLGTYDGLVFNDGTRSIVCCDGNLDLRGTPITSLPEGLTVGGNLDLRDTSITSLHEGLSVGGSLDLRYTSITSLPDGLTVGGDLYLRYTPITSLPDGLTVGGDLDLEGTSITSLPEGLSVGGDLDLEGTSITSLPEGLSVGGDLDLEGTSITSLPEGISVGGVCILETL